MKKVIILIIFLALFVTACQQKPIGGDRDDNGCLTGAGYSYNENVGACTRNWELNEHEKEVARNVLMVQSYSSFTIVSIEKIEDCGDCYDVTLQRNPIDEETKKEKYLEPYTIPYREGRIDYSYDNPITNFDECQEAGSPTSGSFPSICVVDGIEYLEKECSEYGSDSCPKSCVVCPPCEECSSISCQTEEFCESIGFEKEWSDNLACTKEYKPVCGKINVQCITTPCDPVEETFSNMCEAKKRDAFDIIEGECQDKQFVVCVGGAKTFDPKEYAQNNNGICVDRCPESFDPFTTQIGIQLCIPHYGITEIEQWNICDRSTDTCKCAKAYETTDEQQIPDAEYRCVPELYAERLLFRGGIDSLDEDGEQSVMIA